MNFGATDDEQLRQRDLCQDDVRWKGVDEASVHYLFRPGQ
jgi:hypothetical protein